MLLALRQFISPALLGIFVFVRVQKHISPTVLALALLVLFWLLVYGINGDRKWMLLPLLVAGKGKGGGYY
jgi:hypothetical protein